MKINSEEILKPYTKSEYKQIVAKAIERALKKECLIIFFGSINTERFSRISDIDVAVYCGKPLTSYERLKIIEEIEKQHILREVDIVDLASVKDIAFLKKIINEGKIWKNSEELLKDLKKHSESLKK
ncbi:nucleotidyltransferase domain-containing protein [Desulfurobacterium sp.]